ncbi:TonB family protein [uncultured Mailhella sp.]|uniref:TonB family protein n=1 Tax=uncultured Mailhella sp. TaxID=1981031 RepID=UPI00262E2E17|nr:TonB family protein [uncultured Mailhella sp.]
MKNLPAFCALFLFTLLLSASQAQAFTAAADTSAGYGSLVLGQLMRGLTRPAGAGGTSLVEIDIAPDGTVSSCRVIQSSPSPALDAAVCTAAAKGAPYPYPPYGAPATVSLAFCWDDAPAASASQSMTYAEILRRNITPRIVIPAAPSGSWTTTILLDIYADGSLQSCQVTHPSGSEAVDAAVLKAALQPGSITPPPRHEAQHVTLTFTLNIR